MLGLLKYQDDFSKAQGLNQLWYKDTAATAVKSDNNGFAARHAYLIQSATVKGTFSFRIPMKHIFGFCEDYDKIVYGLKNNLTLVRKTDDDAVFRGAAAGAGKVSLKFHGSCSTLFQPMLKSFSFTRLLNQKSRYQSHTERDNVICYQFLNQKVSYGDWSYRQLRRTDIYYCWFPNG